MKALMEGFTHWNPHLGVFVEFKILFTMVDSGLVLKYLDIHASKCRTCEYPMVKFREEQLKAEKAGQMDIFLLNLPAHPGSLEFGPSVCHTKMHIGKLAIDLMVRAKFKTHGKKGYADQKKAGELFIHDQLFKRLGIRVNEVRAGMRWLFLDL